MQPSPPERPLAAVRVAEPPMQPSPPERPLAAVRVAEPADEPLLEEIEGTCDALYQPLGLWPLPPMSAEAAAAEDARRVVTLVAGRPPVGFCRLERVDDGVHVGQVSVLPEHGRRGIGSALMEAACAWARGHGYGSVTLTTFLDPPFNAPWYRRIGFTVLDPPFGPELAAVVDDEADLAALGPRVVMVRRLAAPTP